MKPYPRESSFMPTIKCSMCAADIEISMMGDHVCGSSAPAGEPTPPPDASATFDRMPYNQRPTNGSSLLKPGRQMPPRVDTGAANRPFFRQEQITPISASPSRTGSPFQPGERNSPFGRPLRSATAPIQQRPPSPEFMTGLDSPFPPFPGAKTQSRPRTPQPQQQQRSQQQGGYGGFGGQKAENDIKYAPVSPRTATSGGLLQRMNTIAPGPFDPKGRTNGPTHQRNKTAGSMAELPPPPPAEVQKHAPKLSTSSVNSRSSSNNSVDRGRPAAAPKVPRKNGYGGFGPPPSDNVFAPMPLSPDSRSQTFPRQNEGQEPSSRRPSEPAANPGFGPRMRRPSNAGDSNSASPPRGRRPSMGPDTSRAPPPRGVSLIRSSRGDPRLGDAPPVPSNVNLAAEFGIGNPYHTASESTSSNESGYSNHSKSSSRSSPPATSPARSRRKPSRHPSNTSNIDLLMSEIQSSMTDLQPKEIIATAPPLKLDTSPKATAALPIVEQNTKPAQTLASSYGVQEPKLKPSTYGIQEPRSLPSSYGVQEPKPKPSYGVQEPSLLSPESPTDPAVQGGRLSPVPRKASTSQPPPLTRNATSANGARRPTTSKGTCKHCKLPIRSGQKSVSSADGRLTGRYHKTCFCCTTCLEPFSTSTFYVIDDAPYCERHYHKLNGSMCSTCDKGIEGQYLESERRQKFHPGCLTCADCRRTLNSDYFEMNGKVYCERDAYRRTQQQQQRGGRGGGLGAGLNVPGGTNRMQRRTTRLMMM